MTLVSFSLLVAACGGAATPTDTDETATSGAALAGVFMEVHETPD
jgi:hypothetical protein